MYKQNNVIRDKSFEFSVRIVNLYKYLTTEKRETVLSKQVLRSGTSIGANVSEGQFAQSKADFLTKMTIALKEANETRYWLKRLYAYGSLSDNEFESIINDNEEIINILTTITRTTRENMKKQ